MKKKLICLFMSLVMIIQLIPAVEAANTKSFEEYIVSELLKFPSQIDITSYVNANKWETEDIIEEYQRIILDSPEVYNYTKGKVTVKVDGSKTYVTEFDYCASVSKMKTMKKDFDAATKKALEGIKKDMTAVEKALYIHDYIIVNTAYDTAKKSITAYDCLVGKKAVCQSYAHAFQYLARQAGLTCETISSKTMNHMWNYVKIGSKWYHVDVTHDDPVFKGSDGVKRDNFGRVSHEYFMVSDKLIVKGSNPHKDWEASLKEKGLPKATSTTYDKSVWRDSDSTMVKVGKYWYFLKLNPNSPGLNYKETKSTEIQTFLYRYSFTTKKYKKIYTLKGNWTAWGKSSWYKDSYARLAEYNGKIYMNTKDKIMCYDVAAGKIKTFMKPSTKDGYIYGIAFIDGKLRYTIKKAPDDPDSLIKPKTLKS